VAGLDLTALLDQNADGAARDRAYTELLRLVAIFVRVRMGGAGGPDRLRDHRESADVCQSIAKSFVDDAARGMLRFDSQAALHGYLQQVVRSKLAELARHDGAAKRGGRDAGPSADPELAEADDPSASIRALSKEELERVMAGLTPDEGQVVLLRRQGLEWKEIAGVLGVSEEALRQRWSRVRKRLG
jgi:RNA polymerase sigma factor (sigma-70 family)